MKRDTEVVIYLLSHLRHVASSVFGRKQQMRIENLLLSFFHSNNTISQEPRCSDVLVENTARVHAGAHLISGASYTIPDCYPSGVTFISDKGLSYTTLHQSGTQRSD